MSSISNLNIVVQQGNSAQELQQTRHQNPDQSQLVASQQQVEKEAAQRSTVQNSGEAGKSRITQNGPGKSRYWLRKKKKKSAAKTEKEPGSTGRLLDTIA